MNGQIPNAPNITRTEPAPSPLSQNETPEGRKGLLFEIFFVLIVLVLLFAALNYFNILKLSELFPNYLGFLPHKQSQQYNNTTIAPRSKQSFPTTSLLEPAKQTLTAFLPTILTSSLLPKSSSDIKLTEDKGIKQSVSGSWNTKDGGAITIFTVSPNGREVSQLLLFFPYSTTASASVEFAQSTIPKLFSITPKGKWACKSIPNTANYCENFWEEQSGTRKGIAIKSFRSSLQAKRITISFCEHIKTSNLYSWKSCINEFAQTGIQ